LLLHPLYRPFLRIIRPFPFLSELRAGFTTVLAFFLGGFPCLAYQNLARARAQSFWTIIFGEQKWKQKVPGPSSAFRSDSPAFGSRRLRLMTLKLFLLQRTYRSQSRWIGFDALRILVSNDRSRKQRSPLETKRATRFHFFAKNVARKSDERMWVRVKIQVNFISWLISRAVDDCWNIWLSNIKHNN